MLNVKSPLLRGFSMSCKRNWFGLSLAVSLALVLGACGTHDDPSENDDKNTTETGYVVSGIVTNYADGNPMSGVNIVLGERTATTDEDGYWEFTGVTGTHTLHVADESATFCPQTITVTRTSRRNDFTAHQGSDGPEGMAGQGVYGDPYVIQNVRQLQAINENLDGHYILCNDIDGSEAAELNEGTGFAPIGQAHPDLSGELDGFRGVLNGRNHQIHDLSIDRSEVEKWYEHAHVVGLFSVVAETGQIMDLTLVRGSVQGEGYVGAFAGLNAGRLLNVSNDGMSVQGDENVGGIVGENVGQGLIQGAHNSGSVTGIYAVGGIAGGAEADTTIREGFNAGDVTAGPLGYDAGGIVGENEGLVEYSHNAGHVQGYDNVGGIVGETPEDGTVRDSFNIASVSGRNNVGGVVGSNRFETHDYPSTILRVYNTGTVEGENNVGGVAGRDQYQTSHSFNLGEVRGTGENVGGVIGYKDGGLPLVHSYNMGAVSGSNAVGGIAGKVSNITVEHTYNTGIVKGDANVGGLVGVVDPDATVSMSYFQNDGPDGGPDNGHGLGLSANQLKQSGTYIHWSDFDLFWNISEGDYPDLRDNAR